MKLIPRMLMTMLGTACLSATHAPKVIDTIPITIGLKPAAAVVTPDGKYLYVANNNDDNVPGQATISVIDLSKNNVVQTIRDAGFNQPYTITLNKSGSLAYVTNSAGSTVSIINTAVNNVVGTISGFDGPSGFVIAPNGGTAYVNNYGGPIAGSGNGTTISVVDIASGLITATITVDQAPASLAITPDGKYVYVINYVDGNPGTGTVQAIQTSTNTVVATITGFSGPFNIAITPDGKYAYVTDFGSNNFEPVGTTLSIIDLASNTIKKTIPLGVQPSGVAISPDGRFAYVTNYNTVYLGAGFTNLTAGQGTFNVIDVVAERLLSPLVIVGSSPAAVALSPDGAYAYIPNYTSRDVSVVLLERMWS